MLGQQVIWGDAGFQIFYLGYDSYEDLNAGAGGGGGW